MYVHEKNTHTFASHSHHQQNPPDSSKKYFFTLTYEKTHVCLHITQVTDIYILSAHTYNSHITTCIIFYFTVCVHTGI